MNKLLIYYFIIFINNILFSQENKILKIYFAKDSYDLDECQLAKIDSISNLIKDKDSYIVKLDSHTDSDGTDQYNDKLSEKRAESTQIEIEKQGFKNIEISSFGEQIPIIDNSNENNKKLNRRVHIIFNYIKDKIRIFGKIKSDKDLINISRAKILIKTSDNKIDTVYTNKLGEYEIWVPKSDQTYYLVSKVREHFYHYQKINTNQINENKLELNVDLKKLNIGSLLNIPLFNFIEDKAILKKHSEPSLALLLEVMKQNSKLEIEIHGHINNQNGIVSRNSSGFRLSYERAKLVYDFLKKNNISEKRMKIRAFGNLKMLYPNTKDEKLQDLNRRVEILIISN